MTEGISEQMAKGDAQAAWLAYRDRMHERERVQYRAMRRREFIAGYMQGRRDEARP